MFSLAFTIVGTAIAVIFVICLLWIAICCVGGIVYAIAEYPIVFALLAFIVVAIIIGTTKVRAQLWQGIMPNSPMHLPPVEFDKPYPGKITIETVTNAELRARCAAASQSSLGCSFPGPNSCHILLVDEASMRAVGWTLEVMLRHERAHCNGWPQSHPGRRPYP